MAMTRKEIEKAEQKFRPLDTPPQSAGPIKLFPNLRAPDGTLLSDSKGRPIKHKKSTKAKKK